MSTPTGCVLPASLAFDFSLIVRRERSKREFGSKAVSNVLLQLVGDAALELEHLRRRSIEAPVAGGEHGSIGAEHADLVDCQSRHGRSDKMSDRLRGREVCGGIGADDDRG